MPSYSPFTREPCSLLCLLSNTLNSLLALSPCLLGALNLRKRFSLSLHCQEQAELCPRGDDQIEGRVNTDGYLASIWNHLGGEPLGMWVRRFLGWISYCRKTHPDCGWHHPFARDPELNREGELNSSVYLSQDVSLHPDL